MLKIDAVISEGQCLQINGKTLTSEKSRILARVVSGLSHRDIADEMGETKEMIEARMSVVCNSTKIGSRFLLATELAIFYPSLFTFVLDGDIVDMDSALNWFVAQKELLSPHQKELITLLGQGLSISDIANQRERSFSGTKKACLEAQKNMGLPRLSIVILYMLLNRTEKDKKFEREPVWEVPSVRFGDRLQMNFHLNAGEALTLCGQSLSPEHSRIAASYTLCPSYNTLSILTGRSRTGLYNVTAKLRRKTGLSSQFDFVRCMAQEYHERYQLSLQDVRGVSSGPLESFYQEVDKLSPLSQKILRASRYQPSVKKIAEDLKMSSSTVDEYLTKIKTRLGLEREHITLLFSLAETKMTEFYSKPDPENRFQWV